MDAYNAETLAALLRSEEIDAQFERLAKNLTQITPELLAEIRQRVDHLESLEAALKRHANQPAPQKRSTKA